VGVTRQVVKTTEQDENSYVLYFVGHFKKLLCTHILGIDEANSSHKKVSEKNSNGTFQTATHSETSTLLSQNYLSKAKAIREISLSSLPYQYKV